MIGRWMMACVALWVLSGVMARGQYAPAGNEHPETRVVSEGGAAAGNPFGAPQPPASGDPRVKHAFASALDLGPLRRLAVLHNGRVKILDTLARETVWHITGKYTYSDGVLSLPGGEGEREGTVAAFSKLRYDPVFTLLDLMIDPGYYADKPLIHVNYLPLRRALLESVFPGDVGSQERWMMAQRVAPVMIQEHAGGVMSEHGFEPPYREGMDRVDRALMLWSDSPSNLLLVAPESADMAWGHLSTLPGDHAARRAAAELGSAWRAGDAARANAAIATLAAELPKINAEQYPGARAGLEALYNRARAFEYGAWAYALSLVTLLLAMAIGRGWLRGLGMGLLLLAVGLHAFGFVLRCIIAERFAIQNQFESMTGVSLFGAVVGLGIMMVRRQPVFAAAAAGLGFLVLITATQTAIPGRVIEREAAILNTSVLLKYHVTTVLVSYGLITLGMIVSLFYLGSYYWSKYGAARPAAALAGGGTAGGGGLPAGVQRLLGDLDRAQMTVLQLAFWTLAVGILLGAWWADHSWGRWWAFDPKETWALITWIIYLIVVHVRIVAKDRGLLTAWLSVVGFVVMLWTYFGVNLLLPGLHAYA